MQLIFKIPCLPFMKTLASLSVLLIFPLIVFSQNLPANYAASTWQTAQGSLSKEGVQLLGGNITTPSVKWEYTTGFGAEGYPVIADVDNDNLNDVVCVHSKSLFVLNGATGTLKYEKVLSTSNPAGFCPIVMDLDSDNLNEIILTTDSFLMVLNGFDGSIKWSRFVEPYYMLSGSGPAIADFDSDGTKDIAVYLTNGKVHAFNGNNGSDKWTYDTGAFNCYSELAAANIDSDNAIEIVFCSYDYRLIALDGSTGLEDWSTDLNNNTAIWTPVITDVESDGILDIVIGNNVYYASNGSLRWANSTNPYFGNSCVADLNLDGTKEIYFPNQALFYAYRATDGALLWTLPIDHASGKYGAGAIAVDLYGEKEKELVFATAYDTTTNKIYLIKHDGTLAWTYQNPGHTNEGYAVGDIDNDGCSELIFNPDCCFGNKSIYAIDDLFGFSNCSLSLEPEDPNTVNNEITAYQSGANIVLKFNSSTFSKTTIRLIDSQGKIVKIMQTTVEKGLNIVEFGSEKLSTGFYTVEIDQNSISTSKRLYYSY